MEVINLENVSVDYFIQDQRIDTIKEYLLKYVTNISKSRKFTALDSISLSIKKGERVGIIGANGAGKSTLLKVISKVLQPTSGNINVRESLIPLLELGAGFNFDLSGRENIYFSCAMFGLKKNSIDEIVDQIIEYAGLGEFIEVAVKNYSSGMRARLGFSIAVHINADIMLVDEILSVGDKVFREKSIRTMKNLITSGKTVLFVSHNISTVKELCTRVIWLDKGKIKMIGNAAEVCDAYTKSYD